MTTKTKKTAAPPTASRSATTPAAGGVTRTTMVVTPALAAEWLKSNTRNRSPSWVRVRCNHFGDSRPDSFESHLKGSFSKKVE
jgi:hypothetical protein